MAAGRPNILVITSHDLGRYLGCYGHSTLTSPNLDQLASDGVLFTQAFTTAPQCSPSRAALATGRYPHNNGVLGLTHGNFGWDLHHGERHVAEQLRDAGYTTGLIGVHHESRQRPPEQAAQRCGMDVFLPGGRADQVTARAQEQLATLAHGDAPFYLQVGYFEVHRVPDAATARDGYMGFVGDYITPGDPDEVEVPPFLADTPGTRAELAELHGAVRHLDDGIGALLSTLEREGLAENTLVIVTTDHGLALPRAKCSLYDPGIETALVMRWPERGWRGGRRLDALVSNIDVAPTILAAAALQPGDEMHGTSLDTLLDHADAGPGSATAHRDALFAEMTYHDYYDPRRCVRTPEYKLILNFTAAPSFMDPSQSWRPRAAPSVPENPATAYHPLVELYDLVHDPAETTNIADDDRVHQVRQDLLRRLSDWMTQTHDPLLDGAVTSPLHRWAGDLLAGTGTSAT